MKKTIIALLIALILALAFYNYRQSSKTNLDFYRGYRDQQHIDYYTCSMHPQIHLDKPGHCPICNMPLIPVYEKETGIKKQETKAKTSTPQHLNTVTPSFIISDEQQQLIGVKTALVEKKIFAHKIRTNGRVAFDPELAIAIREFLEVSKNIPELKAAALSRLKLLGMADEEIKNLGKKGAISSTPTTFYLPGKNDSLWIYATLYENEMDAVRPGMESKIQVPNTDKPLDGIVRGIDRVVDPQTRSVRARIEILNGGALLVTPLRPDSFVTVIIESDLGENLVIPKSAVVNTGSRSLVFLKENNENFTMKEIKTGSENDHDVIVTAGLSVGETVVTDATFLVDSESQLKATVAATPTCPEGEVWDVGMAMCMPKIEK